MPSIPFTHCEVKMTYFGFTDKNGDLLPQGQSLI